MNDQAESNPKQYPRREVDYMPADKVREELPHHLETALGRALLRGLVERVRGRRNVTEQRPRRALRVTARTSVPVADQERHQEFPSVEAGGGRAPIFDLSEPEARHERQRHPGRAPRG